MSASTLFDRLRQEFAINSDSALANWLGVGAPDLSKAREKGRVSAGMILRIHERSTWPVSQIRQLLGQSAPQQYHDNPAQVSVTEATQ
jgi:hypothetical protein